MKKFAFLLFTLHYTFFTLSAQPDSKETLKSYEAELLANEKDGNKQGVAATYNKIGLFYMQQANYQEALKNENMALKVGSEINDTGIMAHAYCNMAQIYDRNGNFDEAVKDDSISIELFGKINDWHNKATGWVIMSTFYKDAGDNGEALSDDKTALEIFEDAGDTDKLARLYLNVSEANLQLGNFKLALKNGKKGLHSALSEGNNNYIMEAYSNLAKVDVGQKNYKAAYENEMLFEQVRDTVEKEENKQRMAALLSGKMQDSVKVAPPVKKTVVAAKKTESSINWGLIIAAVVLVLLVFAALAFIFLRIIRKQRKAIEQEKQRADQSEKYKEQFLSGISQEIRTPLNVVSSVTGLLLEKEPRPDQLKYFDAIRKSSETLLHSINGILDLSKIAADKMEVEHITFSLHNIIEKVKQTLSFRAEEKGLQFTYKVDDTVPDELVGDPVKLNQVLINLCGNAIKFTKKGSVQLVVSRANNNNTVCLLKFSVIDTGIGIPKEKMNLLFENFSVKQPGYSGGLGLAVSKQLVELMGGKISAESTPGKGSAFSFIIDFIAGTQKDLVKKAQDETLIEGSTLNGLFILLADDNEFNRMLAKDTLQMKSDVKIDEAENGEQALKLFEENNYDIILMDVQMPVMDGYEAATKIRSTLQPPKSAIPIIALTGGATPSDLEKCKKAGMNTAVAKPFKAWQLINAIADLTKKEKKYTSPPAISHPPTPVPIPEPPKPEEIKPVTDLNYLHNFCQGDEVKIKKYVDMYLHSIPEFGQAMEEALKTSDRQEIGAQLHILKSKMIMMGMTATRNLAQDIEILCRDGASMTTIQNRFDVLLEQLHVSIEELSSKEKV